MHMLLQKLFYEGCTDLFFMHFCSIWCFFLCWLVNIYHCWILQKFREYLSSKDIGIHTPKLISGSSEGGAAVFKLEYKNGKCACLAQSPQLHKQLSTCGGFRRVLEVGDVFRAEDSNTHRHLCEFVGLDAEMEIMRHYFEVSKFGRVLFFIYKHDNGWTCFFKQICDIVDGLFVELFRHLNENWKTELEAINRQYPFEPVKVKYLLLLIAWWFQ